MEPVEASFQFERCANDSSVAAMRRYVDVDQWMISMVEEYGVENNK